MNEVNASVREWRNGWAQRAARRRKRRRGHDRIHLERARLPNGG